MVGASQHQQFTVYGGRKPMTMPRFSKRPAALRMATNSVGFFDHGDISGFQSHSEADLARCKRAGLLVRAVQRAH